MTLETIETRSRVELRAARSIARVLMPAENSIDASLADIARLVEAVARARVEAGVPAETCHRALRSAVASMDAVMTARGSMLDCHGFLARDRDARGMDEGQVGCTVGKAGLDAAPAAEAPRRAVA